jgi:hypothetical protein
MIRKEEKELNGLQFGAIRSSAVNALTTPNGFFGVIVAGSERQTI